MIFNCLACGACCIAPDPEQPFYAETTWTDERKLGPRFVRLNVLRPRLPGMTAHGPRVPHGAIRTVPSDGQAVCAALEGTVGDAVRCSVYGRRPKVCSVYGRRPKVCSVYGRRPKVCSVYGRRPKVCRLSCEPGDDVCREHRRLAGLT